jgi:hypothetical protein
MSLIQNCRLPFHSVKIMLLHYKNRNPRLPYGIPNNVYPAYVTPTAPKPMVPANAATLGPAMHLNVAPVINAANAGAAGTSPGTKRSISYYVKGMGTILQKRKLVSKCLCRTKVNRTRPAQEKLQSLMSNPSNGPEPHTQIEKNCRKKQLTLSANPSYKEYIMANTPTVLPARDPCRPQ